MKHIVFILGSYVPETSPIINCVKNVINFMKLDKTWTITCVCGTLENTRIDVVDGVNVYRVHHKSYSDKLFNCRNKYKRFFLKYAHFLHSIIMLPFFPNTELCYSNDLYNTLQNLNEYKKIDCLVGVFRPYASIAAMMKFRKKHLRTKCICYFLDILRGSNLPFGIGRKHYERLCIEREIDLFRKVDKIIIPEGGRGFYSSQVFNEFKEKLLYLNFPTMLISEKHIQMENDGITKVVFAGTTDKQYRDPRYAIDALLSIADKKMQIHIYGRSDLVSEMEEIQANNPDRFFFHGLVSKAEADEAVDKADYVISLGNNINGVVPSKTFELIGKKKTILHFTELENDSSLDYIERYPNKLVIDVGNNITYSSNCINDFMDKPPETIENEFLKQTFYSATPQAVSEAIMQLLDDIS